MFSRLAPNEARTKMLFVIVPILVVILVGAVDYATGNEYSFSVFYLVALGLAAWFVGKGFAYFISIFSVVVSLAGDLIVSPRYSNLLVPFWNASLVLIFYLVVASLLIRLRSLTRGLEARVQERTMALTQQMAERERLERELLEISEREQRRIGHDLHDSLGQHLTGAALAGQVLEKKLASRGLAEASDAGKVVALVEEGIALSRNLAKGLHPIEIEAAGLMRALEELAATSSEILKIQCRFDCDLPVLIGDAATARHMYRIAQEAITNAVKHGKAKHVQVSLECDDEGIALRVKDDGVGLPDPLPRDRGMGLRIMGHRAEMIGARFEARREVSGGTVVSCVQSARHTQTAPLHEQD
jgi:signal transduction histidine kinase